MMGQMNKISSFLFLVVLMSFYTMKAYGVSEYRGSNQRRINIEIAASGVNRIEVKGDRIAKVIGNPDEYIVEGDSKSGVIFITMNVVAGQVVPVTIITEKGYTQDINLNVKKKKEPKSIVIKKSVVRAKREVVKRNVKSEVIKAIRDIANGRDRDYTKIIKTVKDLEKLGDKGEKSLIYEGYKELVEREVDVKRVSQYSNRKFKIIKYEYSSKPSEFLVKEIIKIFNKALSVSERGNAIIVVYQL